MSDHDTITLKHFVNWLAAILGLGTFAQVVPVAVGVLSGVWVTVQLYGYVKYELPVKRAKLKELHDSMRDSSDETQP
jgi:hypothetical protein